MPPLIDDRPMLKTSTSRLHPPQPVVPCTTPSPAESSSTLHVLTSANLVRASSAAPAAWAMIKKQFTALYLSLLPWVGLLVYRVTPPEPEPPPERARESTRTPLISPEKPALPRSARGASLASSLAGSFRGTRGQ